MELAGQRNDYRQLAEEIGEVLQAAAESADRMQEDARNEAARIRSEAEAELRAACAEGRRILDEARMEADMVRAEAEWQSQEIVARARLAAAERLAGADARLAEVERAEGLALDRLAGVGLVVADAMATLRAAPGTMAPEHTWPETGRHGPSADDADTPAPGTILDLGDADHPTAKVYFVEFPPAAAPTDPAVTSGDSGAGEPAGGGAEIVLGDGPGASLFADDTERSEWAPPNDLPAWWTRGNASG